MFFEAGFIVSFRNLVPCRPNLDRLKEYLISLGATHVITDQELADAVTRTKVEEWTRGKVCKLISLFYLSTDSCYRE